MVEILCQQTSCILCLLHSLWHWKPFQSSGFNDWKNAKGAKRGALSSHEGKEAHKNAAVKAYEFKDVCEGRISLVHPSSMMILLNRTKKFCFQ